MIEPDNGTACRDRADDIWVRVDDLSGREGGTWWRWMVGPSWSDNLRDGVSCGWPWALVEEFRPLRMVDSDLTARAIRRVREALG